MFGFLKRLFGFGRKAEVVGSIGRKAPIHFEGNPLRFDNAEMVNLRELEKVGAGRYEPGRYLPSDLYDPKKGVFYGNRLEGKVLRNSSVYKPPDVFPEIDYNMLRARFPQTDNIVVNNPVSTLRTRRPFT